MKKQPKLKQEIACHEKAAETSVNKLKKFSSWGGILLIEIYWSGRI